MERRIVAQLLTCLDDLNRSVVLAPVMVLGATNRPDAFDGALRRAGRFDREIKIGIPDEDSRQRILKVMTKKMKLSNNFDFALLSKKTHGFVGADLEALTKEAASICISRIFTKIMNHNDDSDKENKGDNKMKAITEKTEDELTLQSRENVSNLLREKHEPLTTEELEPLHVETKDFIQALTKVQPSAKREGFSTIPNVSWDDVGALSKLRKQLYSTIVEPIEDPKIYEKMNIEVSCGVLLFGPPGCGKTFSWQRQLPRKVVHHLFL
eukprot:UN24629